MISENVIITHNAFGKPIRVQIFKTEAGVRVTLAKASSSEARKRSEPGEARVSDLEVDNKRHINGFKQCNGISTQSNGHQSVIKSNGTTNNNGSHCNGKTTSSDDLTSYLNDSIRKDIGNSWSPVRPPPVAKSADNDKQIVRSIFLLVIFTLLVLKLTLWTCPDFIGHIVTDFLPLCLATSIPLIYLYLMSCKVQSESLILLKSDHHLRSPAHRDLILQDLKEIPFGFVLYLKKFHYRRPEMMLVETRNLAISETLSSARVFYSLVLKTKDRDSEQVGQTVLLTDNSPRLDTLERIFKEIKDCS